MTDTPVLNEVAKRVTLKAYSDAAINPGTPVAPSSDPGATGGQVLRRVSSVMNPQIAEFKSNELNTAQQQADTRHGALGVSGTIGGELSPLTYELPMQAVMRCTPAAISAKSAPSDTSSLAATASSSKFTLGSSTWAALGFRVGHTFRPTGLTGANNGQNFTIIGLNGVDATVFPPPADMTADTSCTITVPGKVMTMPDPPVKSKWLIEHYNADADLGELAVECRFTSMKVNADDKVSTIEFGYMGRQYTPLDSSSAPFFSSPTAASTSSVVTSYGGYLLVNGVAEAVVTKCSFAVDLKGNKQDVAFTQYSPEIFTGKADVSGSFDFMPIDNTIKNLALNETEISLVLMLTTANSASADFVTFFFPSVKLGQFTQTGSGEAGISVSAPFTARQKPSATGYDATTILIHDSLAT